jgi:apolipoprotein D and lipocalin family protein
MIEKFLAVMAARILLRFRGSKPTSRFEPVSDFDVGRFLGTWYVAAYIPAPFGKKSSSTSSEYSRGEEGAIKVINRGYNDRKKEWKTEETLARFKESANTGWFVVETDNPLNENRKIIYLNEDYTQAIVVGLVMRTLWITYSDPNVTKRDLDELIARVGELGFKTRKLIRVDQSQSMRSLQHADTTADQPGSEE